MSNSHFPCSQMIRRKKFDKLPIQANYYPLSAATYIEDSDLRMTVLTRQPLGTASLSSGEIEVSELPLEIFSDSNYHKNNIIICRLDADLGNDGSSFDARRQSRSWPRGH
jgi:hypothetical protein